MWNYAVHSPTVFLTVRAFVMGDALGSMRESPLFVSPALGAGASGGDERSPPLYASQGEPRSFSPTVQPASALFDSPLRDSPGPSGTFSDLLDDTLRTGSPGMFWHARQRAQGIRPRRRATPDTGSFHTIPPTIPERMQSVDRADFAVRIASSRVQTPAEERATRLPAPLAIEELARAREPPASLVAPRPRRGALWLQSRRRGRLVPTPQLWTRERFVRGAQHIATAARLLLHPRQLAALGAQYVREQCRFWDEAFREPATGIRCWRPPWLHAYIPLLLWLAVTLTSTSIVLVFHTAVFGALDTLSLALRQRGLAGRILFGGMIFVTSFPPIPMYSTLVILSGFAFGMWTGFVVSYVAALAGAATVFLLSRWLLRLWMTRLLLASGGLSKVVRAIEKQPRLLFLVRLAPYPYNLLNVLLASSEVLSFGTFLSCTALALPKLLVHTAVGASIQGLSTRRAAPAVHGNMGLLIHEGGGVRPALSRAERVREVATLGGLALSIAIFFYIYQVASQAVHELDLSESDEDEMELDEHSSADELPPPVWPYPPRRRATAPSGPQDSCVFDTSQFAPSMLAPPILPPRAPDTPAAHAHRPRPLSIAEQIAELERAVESPT